MNYKTYQSPLVERYSSQDMLYNFSPEKKFITWRKLWIVFAEAEKKLGLPITKAQIDEMKKFINKINYATARKLEEKLKHDVMAHIKAFGIDCPKAKSIIHLGATSAYVVDNTDLILMRDGLLILKKEIVNLINTLAKFAEHYAELPTVAYTHFQPAQFTTVGKRASLWLNDLILDLKELDNRLSNLKFLGVKGAVGTQASFLTLFNGNEAKVRKLDELVTKKMGFSEAVIISGQTYTRKIDMFIHSLLASIAQSAHKFSNDMRLLQHLGELEEPFEEKQVGSSAMAYKKNPVKSERIASLARFVITLYQNSAITASNQWFERTLDDSAGKRLATPEAFLAVDAILNLYYDIISHIKVNEEIIKSNVEKELPFVATENILMKAVKQGGDRQVLHERIRQHTIKASENIKTLKGCDLLKRLYSDRKLSQYRNAFPKLLKPKDYIGRASSQVKEFLKKEVIPEIEKNKLLLGMNPVRNV